MSRIAAMTEGAFEELLEGRERVRKETSPTARLEAMRETRMRHGRGYVIDDRGRAIISIEGTIVSRRRWEDTIANRPTSEWQEIITSLDEAQRDGRVVEIVLEIDSAGSDDVSNAELTAQAIRAISKPVTAVVGNMAAGASYWLASQTDWITARHRMSRVGGIGVAAEEYDDSGALEKAGITRRVYTSTDAPDKRPDTSRPEGQAKVIAQLDDLHRVFARSVAEGRGTSVGWVNEHYGRGGLLIAERALAVGMIDEIQEEPAPRNGSPNAQTGRETNSRRSP